MGEALARGGLQGVTGGWGDEGSAAIAAALPFTDREAVGQGKTYAERYHNAREFYRKLNTGAETQHPAAYMTGQVAGAVAPAIATLGASAPAAAAGGSRLLPGAIQAAKIAGQGAIQGAGYSDATTARGLAGDTALGTGLSLAGGAIGKSLGGLASKVAGRAGEKLGLATAKAGTQAAEDVAAPIASATGELGAEVQKGSRYVENLMRLQESMTPAQKALYQQLEQSGVVPNLQQAVAQSTLERLPGQAGAISSKQAALEALQQAAPQAVKERAAQLMQPQLGKDALSFAKSYAEPLVMAYGAGKAAELAGMDEKSQHNAEMVAGLVFGRTRAGKALMNRITRPGNQILLQNAVRTAAQSAGRWLPGATAAAAPALFMSQAEEKP
jgi:hypothetical protein